MSLKTTLNREINQGLHIYVEDVEKMSNLIRMRVSFACTAATEYSIKREKENVCSTMLAEFN